MFVKASAAVLALVAGVGAFTPVSPLKGHVASTSNLHMSAALIIQNKGGGHGELGTCKVNSLVASKIFLDTIPNHRYSSRLPTG